MEVKRLDRQRTELFHFVLLLLLLLLAVIGFLSYHQEQGKTLMYESPEGDEVDEAEQAEYGEARQPIGGNGFRIP
ncbi:MAG TPA: hypothetical protein VJB88_12860, partial [Vicinamibacteria bacterium]|nr:hypothetical protein [Vicinamibacteria bacterium]